MFVLLVVWTGWATPGFSFVDKLAQRMFGPADHTGPITFEAWVQRVVLAYHGVLHGWLMITLAAVGVACAVATHARNRVSMRPGEFAVPGLVLAWGVAHCGDRYARELTSTTIGTSSSRRVWPWRQGTV